MFILKLPWNSTEELDNISCRFIKGYSLKVLPKKLFKTIRNVGDNNITPVSIFILEMNYLEFYFEQKLPKILTMT